jgi:hypothetical protein
MDVNRDELNEYLSVFAVVLAVGHIWRGKGGSFADDKLD